MTKPRILVVDDDKTTVDLMSAFLRQGGYEVSVAFDAMQGLSAAQRLAPALIVLDVNMPAGGGLQMLERLRRSSLTAAIPTLVVTGTFEPRFADTLVAKGASQVLPKPMDSATLLQAIGTLLGGPPPT